MVLSAGTKLGPFEITSDESGCQEIYGRAFEGTSVTAAGKWRISSGGGSHPIYLAPDRKLRSAEIRVTGPSLSSSEPRALFQTHVHVRDYLVSCDVAADGDGSC